MLHVAGADLLDGTPIWDIKPYLPYADCVPDAAAGFAGRNQEEPLAVELPPELARQLPEEQAAALRGVLAQDPRPRYQDDPARVYGFGFGGWEVRFRVAGRCLTVVSLEKKT